MQLQKGQTVVTTKQITIPRAIDGHRLANIIIEEGAEGIIIAVVPAHTGENDSDEDAIVVNWSNSASEITQAWVRQSQYHCLRVKP